MAGFDQTLEAELADVTGRVPLFLSDFRTQFLALPDTTPYRTQSALTKFSVAIGKQISYALIKFRTSQLKENEEFLLDAWEHLIRGEAASPELFDHSFFYCPKDNPFRSGSVSTIASGLLAEQVAYLRKKLGSKLALCSLLSYCEKPTNPSVQGFLAEQLVLAYISRDGFRCDSKTDYALDISAPGGSENGVYFDQLENLSLKKADEPSIIHYIPNVYNYKHIDSLLRQVEATEKGFTGKGKAKATIYGPPSTLRTIAFQPTLQSLIIHNYSFDFYNSGDYKKWETGAFDKTERHFVWVLRKSEYNKV